MGSTMKTKRAARDVALDIGIADTMRSPDGAPGGTVAIRQAVTTLDRGAARRHSLEAALQGGLVAVPSPSARDLGRSGATRSRGEPVASGVRGQALAELGPGTVIQGDYRIVETIGAGAMGIVMRAHDERLDRPVAIKLVRPSLLSRGFRERFEVEARAMARVNHPNVLQIYASGEHGGVPFFVMELVVGTTLEAWHASQRGAADIDVVLTILDEICRGVAAIHGAGTLHRDLKPSNILLDARLHPRIADLGLAVLNVDASDPSVAEVVGTPAYMAPEAANPKSQTPELRARIDVYSLGCIAYELLTGVRPFEASTSADLLALHATAPVRRPSEIIAELEPFDACIMQALAKNPAERTPTVEALAHALVAARRGQAEPVRILVAEDDADFRSLMEMTLAREFPEAAIESVGDGREALAAFDRQAPSVAILDLQMPAMSGLELTALIRAREASRAMPILVLTGEGGPEEWRRLSALGADRFFVKPVILDDVVSAVRRALLERTGAPKSSAR